MRFDQALIQRFSTYFIADSIFYFIIVDSTILHNFHCDGHDGQNDHTIRRKCIAGE
jgi:hypothetical protein